MNDANDKIPESLLVDKNHVSIQASNGLLTTNGTQSSPFTFTTGTTTLIIPKSCIEVVLAPNQNLRVSEDPLMATYYVVPANSAELFPVAKTDNLYIAGDSAGGVCSIRFHGI